MEPNFKVGDTIRVHQKISESGKERIQIFEGMVIAIKGRGENKMFTVRKIGAAAIGIERIWPLNSPHIAKITVKVKGNVRRAKLYYLRNLKGKERILKGTNEPTEHGKIGGRKGSETPPAK